MDDLGPIPVLIGSIVFAAILIPNVLLFVTYRKYRRIAKLLPSPDAIKLAQPEAIDDRRTLLAAALLDGWASIPEAEKDVTRDALWTAMLLEAAADGNIDHREMQFVADLFGKLAGTEMDFRPVIKSAELVHENKKAALTEIAKAGKLSTTAKEHILAGAFLVSISDHALSERETDCLGDIAEALAMGRRDRKATLQGITERFGI